MAQQTAIEFLKDRLESILELYNSEWDKVYQVIQQAKAMEKEQIIDAYVQGFSISAEGWNGEYGIKDFNDIRQEVESEQYYNQKYIL